MSLITVTSDRGLAGGFNANIGRASLRFIDEHGAEGVDEVRLVVVGRKGARILRAGAS